MMTMRDELIKEALEFNRKIVETSSLGIFTYKATGEFVSANEAGLKLIGATRAQARQQNFRQLESWQDSGLLAAAEEVLACRESRQLEAHLVTSFGRELWLDCRLDTFVAGHEPYLLVMVGDITGRKQLEQTRRESEARLRLVLENMPVLLDALNEELTFVVWNRECERVTGYPAAEIVGNPRAIELLYPDAAYRQEMLETWARTGNNFRNWELQLTDRAGRPKTVAWSNISEQFPIPGWAAWSVGVDVTDRKAAEEALAQKAEALARSNRELEQFAYIASHDLQEPLRMVSSYLQLLQRRYQGRLDAEADEFIGFAVDGANRMKLLINDLLAYSRVGSQGAPLEPTDCEAALEQALTNLRVAIAESAAVIRHDPLPTVLADPVQLAQLFQNLLSNALKFRAEAPPHIRVGVEQRQNEWRFSVRDNGIGIPAEAAERIFLLFERLHGRGHYPGAGIGLALCQKIVTRHGGRIWVESQEGEGATFYFTIPVISNQ
jgi:PAS domain S-box-containing protein